MKLSHIVPLDILFQKTPRARSEVFRNRMSKGTMCEIFIPVPSKSSLFPVTDPAKWREDFLM